MNAYTAGRASDVLSMPGANRRGSLPRNPPWRALSAGICCALLLVLLGTWLALHHSPQPPPRVALVDQLGLTFPDPVFIQDTTALLQQAGYVVDYVPPRAVTVRFYQQLFGGGGPDYSLLLLRVHTPHMLTGSGRDDVGLLTNEPYSTVGYVQDQLDQLVAIGTVVMSEEPSLDLFAVTGAFVSASRTPRFRGATIVLMGCSTLRGTALAKAFMARGVSQIIGWDDDVSEAHTDKATAVVLRHLLEEHLPAQTAVARTMLELGPDPDYGGKLVAFPTNG